MYKLIKYRRWYYRFSGVLILLGLLVMLYSVATIGSPFHTAIDFTGGSLWELQFKQAIPPGEIVSLFAENDVPGATVNTIGDNQTFAIRSSEISPDEKEQLQTALDETFGESEELQFRAVGPTVGREVTNTAFIATILATLVILGFITWAFRQVQHPFRYGAAAILAMLHDILITVGFYSLMGFIAGWEVDALFLTAVLTVIGFSVQDTIVVFDRIRENSRRHRGDDFEVIANRSVLETMQRSIGTQINAMFIMIAILLFGGVTIQHFIATLFVGLLSGTYSSIFIATPILVSWEKREGIFGISLRNRKQRPATAS